LYFSFNQAKPKTEVETKVYDVLSHKNWGSSSTQMNDIAADTYDYEKFTIISSLTWEAMENQRPAAWRVVFKGLTLLEHLVKNGSERCVDDARNHGHTLRALLNFNYYEGTIDRGSGVREKAKQLIEMLNDDERIREDRHKAKQLRERFGQKIGGVGSSGQTSGASGGGGGAGGGAGAGYGNDSWDTRGGGGGGGGSSGGYADGGIDSGGGGNRGRYDNQDTRPTASAAAPAPTFAALPPQQKSKKTKKKKRPEAAAPAQAAAPAADVDLFSFDDPTPAPAPASNNDGDDFAAFQSAGATSAPVHDPFAAPLPAPAQRQQQQMQQSAPVHDPFAAPAPAQQQSSQFNDPFADSGSGGQGQNGSMNNGGGNGMNNAFGAMNVSGNGNNNGMMQQQQQQSPMGGGGQNTMSGGPMGGGQNTMSGGPMGGGQKNTMSGGGNMGRNQTQNQAAQVQDDDDFGDFADAAPSKATGQKSSDPFSSLTSMDGLSKNSKPKEDKMNQPIISNSAAATYVQEREQIQTAMEQSKKGSSTSFAGIDGLHNNNSNMMGGQGQGQGQGQQMNYMSNASNMGSNPNVMGSGGMSSIGNMMDPQAMQQQSQQQQQQYSQQQGGQQGGMGMGNQQQGGMGMGNQQQGGMQGYGNMQGGGMGNQQQMSMNNQGGGGMGYSQGNGNMQGNNMGGNMQGNNMGNMQGNMGGMNGQQQGGQQNNNWQ
jgi:epsin